MSQVSCAVCGVSSGTGARMSRLVMEGRPVVLCREHATVVATARPASFEELRRLFVGASIDVSAMIQMGLMVERRSPIGRRGSDDRRAFPPRPEGRRRGQGRRATDPVE